MQFSTLKTKVANWLNRSDLTSYLTDFVNMAMHKLERDYNWRFLTAKSTGNFTSSSDSITIPTRYKDIKGLFITVDNQLKRLSKHEYEYVMSIFPDGSNSKDEPQVFTVYEPDDKIYVRPYPDATYAYELTYRAYSADLSDDTDTNWWTDNYAWEILFFAALEEAGLFLSDEEITMKWKAKKDEAIAGLRKTEIDEKYNGSPQNSKADYIV